jgi:hypothetical protein
MEQSNHEKNFSKAVQQEISALVKRNKDEPEQRLAEVAAIANVTLFAHFLAPRLNESLSPLPSIQPMRISIFTANTQFCIHHLTLSLAQLPRTLTDDQHHHMLNHHFENCVW